MRRFATALTVTALAALGTGTAVTEAAAAGATSTSLNSSYASVTSSTGKSLHLQVIASQDGEGTRVSVQVSKGVAYGERHMWTFSLGSSSFSYNSSSGKATLNTGNQISPYGSVSLTFSKTGQTSAKCAQGGSMTTVRGTLSGKVGFNTRTKAWGSVGSSTKTMSFATPNTVVINNSCIPGESTMACSKTISWYMSGGGTTPASFGGNATTVGSKTTSIMYAQRGQSLSTPSGASRLDSLTAREPVPTINKSTLTITSKGAVSGSAKLSGGHANTSSTSCKLSGKTYTEHNTVYGGDTWASSPLRFNFVASADIVAPKTGTAPYWAKNTYS